MSKKVWVIDDVPTKQVSTTKVSKSDIPIIKLKRPVQRNPFLSFSLSIIVWGSGQFYNRQIRLGILYFLFMINFYLFMSIITIYWGFIKSSFKTIYIDGSGTILIFGIFYLAGIIVWHLNAWQAYFKSTSINEQSLKGVRMKLLPVMCSLIIPGWGQLLNGQTKKGVFFQVFSITAIAILSFILIILLVWPTLESSQSRLIVEWIFTISVILSPFILVIWIVNIFDAAKVSLNSSMKIPLSKRINYALKKMSYRIQVYGLKNTMLPLIKRTTLICILLLFCVINYHSISKKFYIDQLNKLGNRLSERDMTVIPEIIKKLPDNINQFK